MTKLKKELKIPNESLYATGRRKTSIAKVWMYPGKGKIIINNQEPLEYIKRGVLLDRIVSPLKLCKFEKKYDLWIQVLGGGLRGQADAATLGIARAINTISTDYRKLLKENGFLTRDPRVKERKKYGKRGARKGPQYRKR